MYEYTHIHIYIYKYIHAYICILPFQMENRSQTIFFNPFTVCSVCKWKFVICPFVDKETNGSYSFANGLNGLMELPF